MHPAGAGFPKAAILALLCWTLLLTRASASRGSLPTGGPWGVQAGASRAEPSSCPPLSPSLTARLIKNRINPKIAHVVLNQFEVSVRIK